jgi:hypothetical protein
MKAQARLLIVPLLIAVATTGTGNAVSLAYWHLQLNSHAPNFGSLPEDYTCGSTFDPCDPGSFGPTEEEYRTGTMASGRSTGTVLAYVQDSVCLFGECADEATTSKWNGTRWKVVATEPRTDVDTIARATMAEDRFGIVRVEPCGSVQCIYRWNGSWQQLHPATSPPARDYANIAYDRAHGTMVLFGGFPIYGGYAYPNCPADTWTWDGSTWTPRATTPHPGCSAYQAMAGDRSGGVVLFEGRPTRTWRWNGSQWSLLSTPVHPPSFDPGTFSLAYDPGTQKDVLVLGSATWVWNGSGWSKRALGIGPNPGPSASDPTRSAAIAISGGDTWLWQKDTIV